MSILNTRLKVCKLCNNNYETHPTGAYMRYYEKRII